MGVLSDASASLRTSKTIQDSFVLVFLYVEINLSFLSILVKLTEELVLQVLKVFS